MNKYTKFNVKKCEWKHHLSGGGWGWVNSLIFDNFNDKEANIDFYTAYESQVRDAYIEKPCLAFFHQVISGYIRSLENIVSSENWEHNKKMIVGAFVLTREQEKFLLKNGVKNVFCIAHPTPLDVKKWKAYNFSKTKKIIHVGIHCRRLDIFCELSKNKVGNYNYVYIATRDDIPDMISRNNVLFSKRLSSSEYNEMLTMSVVFLQLTSATANNTILECIARGTPVLVNLSEGALEYLGKDYPLYYNDREDAMRLVTRINTNPEILVQAQSYLDKIASKFSQDLFIKSLTNNIKKCI